MLYIVNAKMKVVGILINKREVELDKTTLFLEVY